MKPFSTLRFCLCISSLLLTAANAGDFFLYHAPTETVLGPYVCETGARLGTAATSWKITAASSNQFSIIDGKGETFGPFAFAENAPVKIGQIEFTISTNTDAMIGKRVEQKLWKEHPETNPRVLAVLRGNPVDGYKLMRTEPDAVVVSNPKGIDRIGLSSLPEDIRQKFEFDPAKAAAYSNSQSVAVAEWQRQQAQQQIDQMNALQQFWSSVEKTEVVQPEYPPPFFQTKGSMDSSTPTGKGGGSGNNGGSSRRNSNSSRGNSITIGGGSSGQ